MTLRFYLSRLLTTGEAFFALFRFVAPLPFAQARADRGVAFRPRWSTNGSNSPSRHLPLGPVSMLTAWCFTVFCCCRRFCLLPAVVRGADGYAHLPAEVIRAALETMPWVLGGTRPISGYDDRDEPVESSVFYFIVASFMILVFMRNLLSATWRRFCRGARAVLTGARVSRCSFTARHCGLHTHT